MATDNSTTSAAVAAEQLREIARKVHETFCALTCASAALQKAEDEQDFELWSRAGTAVRRCCEELESIRADVDSGEISRALRQKTEEVAHG
jgi:hypothetical protein